MIQFAVTQMCFHFNITEDRNLIFFFNVPTGGRERKQHLLKAFQCSTEFGFILKLILIKIYFAHFYFFCSSVFLAE